MTGHPRIDVHHHILPPRYTSFFATLTLPDVEGALAEAEYALDQLGAAGVILLANTHGEYLGAPAHEELYAEPSHAGGFVPYASYRLAIAMVDEAKGRIAEQLGERLEDFKSSALDAAGHAAIDHTNARALFTE